MAVLALAGLTVVAATSAAGWLMWTADAHLEASDAYAEAGQPVRALSWARTAARNLMTAGLLLVVAVIVLVVVAVTT